MRFILYLFMSGLLLFGISSCSKDVKFKIENDTQNEINSKVVTPKQKVPTSNKINTFEPDTLIPFLQSSIPGTNSSPFKFGTRDEGNIVITTISKEYIFNNNGFLRFSISDYGNKELIPKYELELFDSPPTESGKTTQVIIVPNGKGYCLWDDSKNEGSFYGIVINRFLLRIDGYNLPENFEGLQQYIKYFKIDKLVKFSQNN